MYFMLTAEPPFFDEKPLRVMFAHASEQVAPLTERNPNVPTSLEAVVLRCLEKDLEDRYQDVDSLAEALEDADVDGDWDADIAADWWEAFGCPERKRMAAEALEAAAV